jgi:hypothetical protein
MHLHAYVSQKMREVARFLSAARPVDASIVRLEDSINSAKFLSVVGAVNRVAQSDAANQRYGKPSLASKIGHSLRRCAEIVEANALISENAEKRRTAKGFRWLCNTQWSRVGSSHALSTYIHENTTKRSSFLW